MKKNIYTCQECKHKIVTVDKDDGTTPFMISCKTENCDGAMYSQFYQGVPDDAVPTYEWRIPTKAEIAEICKGHEDYVVAAQKEHYRLGGLELFKI